MPLKTVVKSLHFSQLILHNYCTKFSLGSGCNCYCSQWESYQFGFGMNLASQKTVTLQFKSCQTTAGICLSLPSPTNQTLLFKPLDSQYVHCFSSCQRRWLMSELILTGKIRTDQIQGFANVNWSTSEFYHMKLRFFKPFLFHLLNLNFEEESV